MATDINDLPATSPHGSDFGDHAQILGLAPDPNATRGTATAHRNKCCDPLHRLDVKRGDAFQKHTIFMK
jgi:hypothetical protein